ncbi:MAG TPA: M13 family metallopeptidase [Gemmatimonadaceae bacterium]|nr:M13 family metallopeptidase [Gemmatimonadaceae bacterium]
MIFSRRQVAHPLFLLIAFATALNAQAPLQTKPFDRANLDTTVNACQDFYQFANGGWLTRAKIPGDYSSYGAFDQLFDQNQALLREIVDTSVVRLKAGQYKPGTDNYKMAAFYSSCMDTVAIERLGATPLKPGLDRIAAIKNVDDLKRALGELEHSYGLAPIAEGSAQDAKDAANTIAGLYQGGLSLPNNEYYTKTDTASANLRAKFVASVAKMFQLVGDAPAKAAAEANTVLAVETRFAKASRTPIQLRDVVNNYHGMTLRQVDSLTPHFSWEQFYRSLGITPPQKINVGQPEFFQAFDKLLTDIPVADWKTLLRWRLIHYAAPSLSTPFVQQDFEFNKLFTGATEISPRWKRCTNATDNYLGEILGQEFVARKFTPAAKARAVTIVDNLVRELRARIEQLQWMSPETRQQALVKLDAFNRKIGYPDKWRDYSKLQITPGNYYANVVASNQFLSERDWAKIGKPTDRTEWGMTPPTVNAYENPLLNEIVFPAGILQPPFYDPNADDALNYGAMGAVIGHEMSHAFDDQGRQYDRFGNMRDWWTKEDATKYETEANKIVTQFDAYTVLDTATHVQGKLTLGENIGDFGGLTVAYAAMKRALAAHPQPVIDGFTPEQRFFLGWAQVWRELDRPEFLRYLVSSNPHPPSKWRVNGPLSNMPEFKAAWDCKEGDPMVRAAGLQPRIW